MATTNATKDAKRDLSHKLKADTARAHEAHDRLLTDEKKAWARYDQAIEDVIAQLKRDLAEGKAELEAERAAQAAQRKATVQLALDRGRAAIDTMRVQADLLSMETRDHVIDPAHEAATRALLELRHAVDHVVDTLTAG